MIGRIPLAQPLTLDWNLVSVRNERRAAELLSLLRPDDTRFLGLLAAVAALQAQVAALAVRPARVFCAGNGRWYELSAVVVDGVPTLDELKVLT